MLNPSPQVVIVRKQDLPIPLIVEGEHGQKVVLSIEPAGKEKLGARIGEATQQMFERVNAILRRR